MYSLKPCKTYQNHYHSPFISNLSKLQYSCRRSAFHLPKYTAKRLVVKASNGNEEAEPNRNERRAFLTLEEAGLVEISGLSTHERFLCRLTISSLNLLRVIAEQEGCSIEELNAGRVCDWFLKDKLKREQNIGSAVLQWDDEDPFDIQF